MKVTKEEALGELDYWYLEEKTRLLTKTNITRYTQDSKLNRLEQKYNTIKQALSSPTAEDVCKAFEDLGYKKTNGNDRYVEYSKPFKRAYISMMKQCETVGREIITVTNYKHDNEIEYHKHEEREYTPNTCHYNMYNHNVDITSKEHNAIDKQIKLYEEVNK